MHLELYFDPGVSTSLPFVAFCLDATRGIRIALRPVAGCEPHRLPARVMAGLDGKKRAKIINFVGGLQNAQEELAENEYLTPQTLKALAESADFKTSSFLERLHDPALQQALDDNQAAMDRMGLGDYPVLVAREGRECCVIAYELEPEIIRQRITGLTEALDADA